MSEPDLFDNPGAPNTDGYDRWHAERLAEPRVGPQQPELAVGADEAGYSAWKNEVGEEQIAFEPGLCNGVVEGWWTCLDLTEDRVHPGALFAR